MALPIEIDSDTTHPEQWINFYTNDEEDPNFVFRSATGFPFPCMQWHNLTIPLLVRCFTVATHYNALAREWGHPLGEMDAFFHEVKIIHTNRGPEKEGEKMGVVIFYGKVTTLRWDPDRWR
jgi:hypothetical protein